MSLSAAATAAVAVLWFRLTGRGMDGRPVDPAPLPFQRISRQDYSRPADIAMEALPVDFQACHVKFGERVENLGPVLGSLA